jgi:energy-coupling factor transport system substrate-specific component
MTALFSLLAASLALLPLVLRFGRSNQAPPRARDLMPVVVLAALAVVGRLLFEAIPNFQPTTALIILAGLYFGRNSGLLCGMVAALVSNFFAGQGFWTPWQMLCWGAVGYAAGLLMSQARRTWLIALFGAFASLAYGLVMDLQYFVGFAFSSGWSGLAATLAAGLPFNLIHAASTVIFLALVCVPWGKKLGRLKRKYDLTPL